MNRIGILSDTHGHHDDMIAHNLALCDEIWHMGDIGNIEMLDTYQAIKPLRAVYGNIDGQELRKALPLKRRFIYEEFEVLMVHIGGYPGNYDKSLRNEIRQNPPDIFLSGHSHILKIIPDNKLNLLHINPGSAGKYGLHKIRTMVIFELEKKKILDVKVIELGLRGVI
ncbi:MAG: metallophosphoesterase family protein [Bacteroidetes bacterium]|nr:metallophosphoesterase family protein [Bacteroidota bacterium]